MTLAAGLRLGPYEVVSAIGAGGMGEVYQARDTRLDRTVAIKVLPAHLSGDPERRKRLAREAKAISALSHPHICVLYDVGAQDGVDYLVMEYLEGETLAERLRRGPLPLAEALRHAVEMAEALARAHRAGIVHRDLKPGNVMLTRSGAKLLDFGLATLRGGLEASGAMSESPTRTQEEITGPGEIVGTLAYMAPEQLQGKALDARTDMFAFGGMLHEMVTGQRAFTGPSQSRLIAAILEGEPEPLSKLQPRTPPALERVVSRCLAKDPEDRWQSALDLAAELEWIAEGGSSPSGVATSPVARTRARNWLPWIAAFLLTAGGLTYTLWSRRPVAAKPVVARYLIAPPPPTVLAPGGRPALSPQGTRVAFAGMTRGDSELFVRDLSTLVTTKVEGSEGGTTPFWSPDGRRIGFMTAGKLKVADLDGGAVQTLCDAEEGGGAAWSSADVIVLFTLAGDLVRASPRGGRCTPVPNPNPERRHDPAFFPDGRHFSYHAVPKGSGGGRPSVYVGSLDSEDRKLLLEDAYGASYSSTGHLLFVKAGALMARPFDAKRLAFTGDEFLVSRQVALTPRTEDRPTYSVSANGVLAWKAGPPGTDRLQLTWFDRQGRRLGTLGEVGDYSAPALSRDGRSLAVGRRDPETRTRDIWIFDLERGTSRRLTFGPADDVGPAWSPDGKWVAFSSNPGESRQLYRKPVNGAEGEERLTEHPGGGQFIEDWSPDGSLILQNRWEQGQQPNLFLLPVSSTGVGDPIVFRNTRFAEHMAQFSPDGRWIAYTSSESGREEAYVGPVPGAGRVDGKWLVSTSGGLEPRWRGDGRELYYVSGSTLMAVDVQGDRETFKAGQPRPLFDVALAEPRRNRFVVSRDGQRFLVNSALTQSGEQIDVLVNWMPQLGAP